MHPEMEMLRCAIVRGGTSKGVFIMKNELPKDPVKRDAVIRAIYGSDPAAGASAAASTAPASAAATASAPAASTPR